MKILFVKDHLAWPRSSEHDVHTYHMIRALAGLGHAVTLATADPVEDAAVAGLPLAGRLVLADDAVTGIGLSPPLTGLRERFRSYWGVSPGRVAAVRAAADASGAEAVVVVGLGVLPYLGALDGPLRVWYAGDEWAWHHLSQVRPADPASWRHVRDAAIKGLYEWAYRGTIDRAWVVSAADRRALGTLIGRSRVDVVPNGVDGDHFRPVDGAAADPATGREPPGCVFWGRLDFGPNVQALEWFARRAWPLVRRRVPDARFAIYGFRPTAPVERLADLPGVSVVPDLPDLRAEVAQFPVVVLPFVSGGGIKNKFLEAAGMARAIVASPVAANGLRPAERPAWVVARSPSAWADALAGLWAEPARCRALGAEARRWVLDRHTWDAAARAVAPGLAAHPAEGAR